MWISGEINYLRFIRQKIFSHVPQIEANYSFISSANYYGFLRHEIIKCVIEN